MRSRRRSHMICPARWPGGCWGGLWAEPEPHAAAAGAGRGGPFRTWERGEGPVMTNAYHRKVRYLTKNNQLYHKRCDKTKGWWGMMQSKERRYLRKSWAARWGRSPPLPALCRVGTIQRENTVRGWLHSREHSRPVEARLQHQQLSNGGGENHRGCASEWPAMCCSAGICAAALPLAGPAPLVGHKWAMRGGRGTNALVRPLVGNGLLAG